MQCCSFCRKPSVLTEDCGCKLSSSNIGFQTRRMRERQENNQRFEDEVIVPIVNEQDGSVEYRKKENIAIILENYNNKPNEEDSDEDILEINADEDLVNKLKFAF